MSSYRLLVPCLALVCGVQVAAHAAEDAAAKMNRVIPQSGVRYERPLRTPNRLESEIAQAQVFLASLNARLLTTGAGTSELSAITAWADKLQKAADELSPGPSLWEQQQLSGIARELDRASESIILLTGTVASATPAPGADNAALPAAAAPAEPAVTAPAEPAAPQAVAEPEAPMVPAVTAPAAPAVESVVPAEPEVPAEPAAPVVEPEAPMAEPVAPIVEPVAPVVEEAAPVVEPAAPEVVAPFAEPTAPMPEPAAEPVAPVAEPMVPVEPAPPIELPNQ